MSIIDHGEWVIYKPDPIPAAAPNGALFAQRVSDGQDWYQYVHAKPPETPTATPINLASMFNSDNFQLETVKFTALWQESLGAYIVGAAVYDPLMLFPGGGLLGEITDYTGTDPQTDLGGKAYDPAAGTFSVAPPAPIPPLADVVDPRLMAILEDMLARISALEVKAGMVKAKTTAKTKTKGK
jgi:hypothetical protein